MTSNEPNPESTAKDPPDVLPEPSPVIQELVALERVIFDPNTTAEKYQQAGNRLREINDMIMAQNESEASLRRLSNEELRQLERDSHSAEERREAGKILYTRTAPLEGGTHIPQQE